VIGRENDTDWYEACNPAVPDARGLVPVAFFQALGKTERDSGGSAQAIRLPDHDSGYSDTSGSGTLVAQDGPRLSKTMGKGSGAMVYGIVMYDFAAERPDELEAKAGEAIIVIAQSNPEWFVAKPIGRLGGPGLIPVSFIEIRDMTSGQAVPDAQEAVQRAGVPKVEEWKKMAADYKNSSITLGKFEANSQQQSVEQGMERMSLQNQGRQSQQNGQAFVRLIEFF
jgi:bud emergence protein 1